MTNIAPVLKFIQTILNPYIDFQKFFNCFKFPETTAICLKFVSVYKISNSFILNDCKNLPLDGVMCFGLSDFLRF